ncbi:uncharacterized protein [Panulirus ornatus]|uniref:uncharacterized protein n=1 Tax=Panulirus ornatus TaxID=150431 RepID=UPI003A892EF4
MKDDKKLCKLVSRLNLCCSRDGKLLTHELKTSGVTLPAAVLCGRIRDVLAYSRGDDLETIPTNLTSWETRYPLLPSAEVTPSYWPPVTKIQQYDWSNITPQPWSLMCLRKSRNGKLHWHGRNLKVLVKIYSPTRERYVLQEIQGVPAVPKLLGITSAIPRALILERCQGKTFGHMRKISQWSCLEGLVQLCRTMAILHGRGIVHGDLNKHNLIVDRGQGKTSITLLNYEKARNILYMEPARAKTHLHKDLAALCHMAMKLKKFKCVKDYREFVLRLQAGQQSGHPVTAAQMAEEMQAILDSYPDRPSLFCMNVKRKVRGALKHLRRVFAPRKTKGGKEDGGGQPQHQPEHLKQGEEACHT